jgi:hypothetical protein
MWDKGEPKRPDIRLSATFSEALIAQIDGNTKPIRTIERLFFHLPVNPSSDFFDFAPMIRPNVAAR